MPTPNRFQYYLINASGNYYACDNDGVVSTTSTKTPLRYSPVDWKELQVSYGRDSKYLGIVRKLSVPIQFVKDAASIIRYVLINQGYGGYLKLVIERLHEVDDYNYDVIYEGEIDLQQISSTDFNLSAQVAETGLKGKIESNEDAIYEIDLDTHPDAVDIAHNGIELQGEYRYMFPETLDSSQNPITIPATVCFAETLDMSSDAYIELGDTNFSDTDGIANTLGKIFECRYPFTGTFECPELKLRLLNGLSATTSARVQIRLHHLDKNNSNIAIHDLYTDSVGQAIPAGGDVTRTISFSQSITMARYEWLFVSVRFIDTSGSPVPGTAPTQHGVVDGSYDFFIKSVFVMPFSTSRGISFFNALKHVISQIDPSATLTSSYFTPTKVDYNLRPYYLFLTNGLALRNVSGSTLKITLSNLLQAAKAIMGLTFDVVGNTARIDKYEKIFDNSQVLYSIPEGVKNYKYSVANDMTFSLVEVGYSDQDNDEVNGLQVFGSKQQYNAKITGEEKKLDLISPFRADPFEIEYARSRQFVSNKSKTYSSELSDAPGDNDVFLIASESPLSGSLYSPMSYTGTTGFAVANSTIYNLALSPKTNLLRSMTFIKSCLPSAATFLYFQSAMKNAGFTYTGVTNTIQENSNLFLSVFTRLFYWVYHEFESVTTNELSYLLNDFSTKYGRIEFTDRRGKLLSGFPIDIHVKPAAKSQNTYKLLSAATDNPQDLIYYS